jgi:trigger factor
MQVTVESPTKIQRRITIIVPVETFDQAYDRHLIKLSKTAKINGFRAGKIPLDVIKQRFGDSARQEALSDVIQTSLYTAINQEKLNPVGTPTVEPKNIELGQPLEFVATFEVLPEIGAIQFAVDTLEKQTAIVQEADVTKVIEHLRQQQTKWKKVERAAQDKDQVVIDFKGTIDGVPFSGGEAHDYTITLGSKTMLPGFEEGIIGAGAGEAVTIKVPFPENYFAKEVAGKNAEFAIKVIKVLEADLPALDEPFIKTLGVKSGTLEDLRAEIQKNLERELERVVKLKVKSQVFDKLIEQNTVEIPQALVEREAQRIHDELHPHHKGHAHGHSDAEMAVFNQAANRNVILGLLVGEYVKQNNIVPSKDRIEAHINLVAAAYENPAEVTEWYASNKKARAEVEMQVLEEQVVEKLLDGVKLTEKQLSYGEIMNNAQATA